MSQDSNVFLLNVLAPCKILYLFQQESAERKPLEELGDLDLSEDEMEEEEKIHAAPSPAVVAAVKAAAAAVESPNVSERF